MPAESYQAEITSETDLRSLYDQPLERVIKKQLTRLDDYCTRLIALSPLMCLATTDAAGNADVSPRGDAPGFVRVVDDRTLLIPDRRGNNRLDSLANIVANPQVGLLFMVPGINETVRVNGSAKIVADPALRQSFEVAGKVPATVIVVTVRDAYFHCAKAFMRGKVWDPDSRVERGVLPGLGRIVAEQIAGQAISDAEAQEADAVIKEAYRTKLY